MNYRAQHDQGDSDYEKNFACVKNKLFVFLTSSSFKNKN